MLVKCLNCDCEFEKCNSACKRSPNHFCGRSCAASYNNTKNPKRVKNRKCLFCDNLVLSDRQKCPDCIAENRVQDMTLKEATYEKHHRSSAFALVRTRARAAVKKLGWTSCCECGYDKHIEVCHIKPIADFPEDTLISVINDESNLKPLCPNCHWEFDNLS